jgi:hypothetical protein
VPGGDLFPPQGVRNDLPEGLGNSASLQARVMTSDLDPDILSPDKMDPARQPFDGASSALVQPVSTQADARHRSVHWSSNANVS